MVAVFQLMANILFSRLSIVEMTVGDTGGRSMAWSWLYRYVASPYVRSYGAYIQYVVIAGRAGFIYPSAMRGRRQTG